MNFRVKPTPTTRAAVAVLAASTAVPAAPSTPSINWVDCPNGTVGPVDCGEIKVPLNHSHPEGDTVTLSLARLRAKNNNSSSQGVYM